MLLVFFFTKVTKASLQNPFSLKIAEVRCQRQIENVIIFFSYKGFFFFLIKVSSYKIYYFLIKYNLSLKCIYIIYFTYTMIYINISVTKSDKMSAYSSTSLTVACDKYLKEFKSGEMYSETSPVIPS